jgi:hypothetical protein
MISTQNLSLYKIASEYQSLFNQLYDPETGEINMEIQAQIDALEPSAEKKCIAVTKWINNMRSDKREIEFLKAEILKREAAYEKEINKWENYLRSNMERLQITEVKCPLFTIRLKKNPYSTDIFDESLIPEKFMRTREIVKTEVKADKNAIKEEVLKTGVQIPGASVQQKTKLEILTDKI